MPKDLTLILAQTLRLHPLLTDVPLLRFGHVLHALPDTNQRLLFPKLSLFMLLTDIKHGMSSRVETEVILKLIISAVMNVRDII